MHSDPRNEQELPIAEQAARWFYTLQRDPTQQDAFGAWLAESPRHVEEYLLVAAVYRQFDELDPAHPIDVSDILATRPSNVRTLPAGEPLDFEQHGTRARATFVRSMLERWKVAAAIAVICIATTLFFLAAGSRDYSTDVGEQSIFDLPDGSVVHLNTQSRIQVRYTTDRRSIRLLAGEALFKVARDSTRPFEVHSDAAVIRAVGTQFNIRRRLSETQVSVIEGIVQIYPGSKQERLVPLSDRSGLLKAGQQASVAPTGAITRRESLDAIKVQAWQQRRLVFRGDRLADVAAEFNRYNQAPRIHVEGEETSNRRLMGIFDADDPESLILFFKDAKDLHVTQQDGTITVRGR